MSRVHAVIPDCQVKPGQDYSFLRWVGNYLAEKKPDVIVQIGDFADMPSLSSYDVGKKSFEGRRYKDDVAASKEAMQALMDPIVTKVTTLELNHKKRWHPELHLTLGNHENRINKATENDSKLDGTLSVDDLGYSSFGFNVHEFLRPVILDGVGYCHYFTSGALGRPVTSARQLILKKHQSCVMGHNQNWDIHRDVRADGKGVIGLFSGSCYLHDEDYLGPQGNHYNRGIWMLYEVNEGDFHPLHISLNFLKKRYDY